MNAVKKMKGKRLQVTAFKRFTDQPFLALAVVIIAFLAALISLRDIRVAEMGDSALFVFTVIPPVFWVGICIIACMLVLMIPRLGASTRFQQIFIASSILLLLGLRMAFPAIFTTIPAYEPDATNYMTVISSWANNGIDFGVEKAYQHDYPLSFLTGYTFVKLGVPVDTFFRIAPFVIYAINALLIYAIIKQISPPKSKYYLPEVSIFLFSFSSLGYWISVHYCPDLFGSMMYLLSLYLIIRFAMTSITWSIKALIPMCLLIFLLILSHHLSTLYLIITLMSFAIAIWFFKPPQYAKGALCFFIMGIFTYTLWFIYGSLVYPSFFNVYVYFSGFDSLSSQTAAAGWINNLAFAVYPALIFGLFGVEFWRNIKPGNLLIFIKNLRSKLAEIRVLQAENSILVFTAGFILVFLLFVVGFAVPALFGTRILEVLCIGLYPMASQTLFNLSGSTSRWKKALLVLVITVIVFVSIYRYYTQIQRRVTF